jgi:DNA polymerase V
MCIWQELRKAVAAYAGQAAEDLRAEGLEAWQFAVFGYTNPHNGDSWRRTNRSARTEPTSDTWVMVAEARLLLEPAFRPGFRYAKEGIIPNDLVPAGEQQRLFVT